MQQRLGCQAATGRAVKLNGFPEFDRCPLAILRDADGHDRQWMHWAPIRYLAQRTGNLAVYLPRPAPVAVEVLTFMGQHYLERAAQQQQQQEQ